MWPTLEGQHAPKLRVISRARGGTTTASTLPFLEYLLALDESGSAPDLILVDFSVNDARESQDWTVDIGKEAAAAASFTRGDRVFAATEAFLRFALRKGSSALLLVESQYYEPESLDAHRAAASLYGVPFLAYGDCLVPPIVDAVAWGPPNSAVINWAHPPAATHPCPPFLFRRLDCLPSSSAATSTKAGVVKLFFSSTVHAFWVDMPFIIDSMDIE